jgi:hypothetical protein
MTLGIYILICKYYKEAKTFLSTHKSLTVRDALNIKHFNAQHGVYGSGECMLTMIHLKRRHHNQKGAQKHI